MNQHYIFFELDTHLGTAIWHTVMNLGHFQPKKFYDTYLRHRFPDNEPKYLCVCRPEDAAERIANLEKTTDRPYMGECAEGKSHVPGTIDGAVKAVLGVKAAGERR